MPTEKPFSAKGLYLAVAIWLVGMTAGFLLLSMVYTGPGWVRMLVYLLYLLVVFLVIRSARRLARALKKSDRK